MSDRLPYTVSIRTTRTETIYAHSRQEAMDLAQDGKAKDEIVLCAKEDW